jgi:hypothetical protein
MEAQMTGRLKQVSPRVIAATIALGLLAGLAAGCGSSSNSSSTTAASTTASSTTAGSSTSASALAPIHGTYSPKIDPSNFVSTIDNRYFPLIPGTGFHYTGVHENGKTPQRDDMIVTHQKKTILGVPATVVRDTVSSNGRVIERTFDWYAQDKAGNVWYMGEDSLELKNGHLAKAPDSWEGGVNGAKPGIIMPGNPQQGDQYRQEYYPNVALDQAKVLGSGGPVKVPQGSYNTTLKTVETAPKVDPGVAEQKYYVAGVGDIKEQTVRGNHEHIQLVSITHH